MQKALQSQGTQDNITEKNFVQYSESDLIKDPTPRKRRSSMKVKVVPTTVQVQAPKKPKVSLMRRVRKNIGACCSWFRRKVFPCAYYLLQTLPKKIGDWFFEKTKKVARKIGFAIGKPYF